MALARPERRTISVGAVFLLLGSSAGLVYPQAFRILIDDMALPPEEAQAALRQAVLLMVGVVAVQSVSIGLRMHLFTVAGERIVARLRESLFRAILDQEIAFFDRRRTGELISRLSSDTTVLQSTVTVNASMAVRNVIMAVGGAVLMFGTSPRLGLVMLAFILPIVVGAVLVGKRISRISRERQDVLAGSSTVAEEAISGIRTVRAFHAEEREARRYGEAAWKSFDVARRRIGLIASFVGISYFASFAGLAVVVWFGLQQLMAGTLTSGELFQFALYGMTVGFSLSGMGEIWTELMAARGASERVFELLDRAPEMPLGGGEQRRTVEGRVELSGVRFSYPSRPGDEALRGVDLVVRPGEIVALVGPSGAGKSTIAALIPRFYDPTSGSVQLDGVDVRRLDPSWLRGRIGIVAQEPIRFSASIAENIRYGRQGATDADVEAAARAANAHGFITALPDGYATQVGERGVQLSGGQKQRVAIARAILKDPAILILDEATSALDAESEALVKEALERLMRHRTSLVIAHRLSTVKDADRVVVLDAGRVVQSGRHDELMAEDGLYQRLVARQFVVA